MLVTLTMNPCLDAHVAASGVAPTRKVRCSEACREPGGGGINVARAARKLGGSALAVYPLGGKTGELLHGLLEGEGVPDETVRTVGLTRENLTVFDEAASEEYRFVMAGPALSVGEWRRVLDLVTGLAEGVTYVVASGSLPAGVPEDFYGTLARALRGTGARLCLDTSSEPLRRALAEGVFLVKPNFRELEQAVGRPLADDEERLAACRNVVGRGGAEVVALTLEERGALLVWRDGHLRIPGLHVPVRSSVGAGDSFMAGMVVSLARGRPLKDAFRYGVAAGSAAVMTPGSELCRRADTDALFGQLRSEWAGGQDGAATGK